MVPPPARRRALDTTYSEPLYHSVHIIHDHSIHRYLVNRYLDEIFSRNLLERPLCDTMGFEAPTWARLSQPGGFKKNHKGEEINWFRVMSLGFRVWDLGFGVWGSGFGVWGLGFWVLGFGVWVLGLAPGRVRLRPDIVKSNQVLLFCKFRVFARSEAGSFEDVWIT